MTNQVIPDEAVEAAAKAYRAKQEELGYPKWEDLPEWGREMRLDIARAALEASAPHIAGAWHDAVSEAYVEGALSLEQASVMWAKNPYRTPNAR